MKKRNEKSNINAVSFDRLKSALRLNDFIRFENKKIKMTQNTEKGQCQQSSPDRRPSN